MNLIPYLLNNMPNWQHPRIPDNIKGIKRTILVKWLDGQAAKQIAYDLNHKSISTVRAVIAEFKNNDTGGDDV